MAQTVDEKQLAAEKDVMKVKAAISAIRSQKATIKRNYEDWFWLIGTIQDRGLEYRKAKDEARAKGWRGGAMEAIKIREDGLEEEEITTVDHRKLPPIPATNMRKIGWISTKPEFKLEKYVAWRLRIPFKAPEVWERPDFDCTKYKIK